MQSLFYILGFIMALTRLTRPATLLDCLIGLVACLLIFLCRC